MGRYLGTFFFCVYEIPVFKELAKNTFIWKYAYILFWNVKVILTKKVLGHKYSSQ